jgi:TatD DNase family protein
VNEHHVGVARPLQVHPRERERCRVDVDGHDQTLATPPPPAPGTCLVLSSPSIADRVLSVHSRGAEAETIAALTDAGVTAILHWYSGALKHAERALEAGLYFSVNAAMLRTHKGSRLIRALPRERVLTETDGPYVAHGARASALPTYRRSCGDLAGAWSCDPRRRDSESGTT